MAGAGLVGAASTLAVVAALQARPLVQHGMARASLGVERAARGEVGDAAVLLEEAADSFADARARLHRWWASPSLVVPVVGENLAALRAMAGAGEALGRTAGRALGTMDVAGLRLTEGTVPVERIAALEDPAAEALAALAAARGRLDRVESRWLLPPVSSRLGTLSSRVGGAEGGARAALAASRIAPPMLGRDRPRRYFLAVQTPAEARATGGLIGSFGEIGAHGGRITLARTGRTDDLDNAAGHAGPRGPAAFPADYAARYGRFEVDRLWQNLTMSPDFPTVSRAIAEMYPRSGGNRVDGVIAIDPFALAALLEVLGPVEVPGWPVPISGQNAASVLLHQQYASVEGPARVDFLTEVTEAVWKRLTTGSVDLSSLARHLAPAVAGKHLQLASFEPAEQSALSRMGAAGQVAPVRGDFLGVVTQNAGGNKIDWFLRRRVSYTAAVDRDGLVRSTVRVNLENQAPPSGLPRYVIGSATRPPMPEGTSRLYLSLYTPLLLEGAEVDGRPLLVEPETELGRNVYSAYVTLPPGASSTVEMRLTGALEGRGGYRLDLHRQPVVAPDTVDVSVSTPDGHRSERLRLARDRTIGLGSASPR